ncbi:hypothetical protein ACVWYI_003228 [Bradyrhizobium sp. LB13.1]
MSAQPLDLALGEIAVDTADAGLADLGDLLEQSIRDLGRSIVGINQDGETGRTEL